MQSPDDPPLSDDRKRFAQGASTLLAAGFVVLAVVIVALVWLAHRNESEVAWVQHTQDVEIRLSRLLGLIRDAESGQRGYLLTGDERYLAPYRASADATAGEIAGLAARVADNPRQNAALATLRPLVSAKLRELRETVELRRAGDADAAASAVRTDRGLALMHDIRGTLDGMRAEEDGLLAARIAEARHGAALLMAGAACGGGLLAILAVFSVRSVRRYTNAVDAAHRALLESHRRRIAESEERRRVEEALQQAQKMESVGQLTGGIAHDFNNLLTIVSGNLDLLESRIDHDPATTRLVRIAAGAAQRAEALTKQLLAFARRQELHPVTLDVNQVVLGVQDLLRQTVGPAIKLRLALAPDLWSTTADKSQIEIALLNLAVNARDAMPTGGGFAVETDNVVFDAEDAASHPDRAPGAYVRLAVRDTGCGMPPDVVRRAFEPFFTTKNVGKGTGLGLSMVFGFVRQSKGHVQIDSEPNRGTAVIIHLPRADAAPAASRGAAAAAEQGVSGETVLVVEDDANVRDFAVSVLERLGCRVLSAKDGETGLATLERHPEIGVLFSDIVMPGRLNGLDLARAARARRPELPILLTTAYAERLIEREGMPERTGLLPKPYRTADLVERIVAIFSKAAE